MYSLLLALLFTSAQPAPTLDDLIAKYDGQKKQIADLTKAQAETVAAIKSEYDKLHKSLAERGILDPTPLPPAPPPKPVDPLVEAIRAAYLADGKPRLPALQLAALYEQAAELAKSPEIASTADLLRRVREAEAFLTDDTMVATRKLVGSELLAALGKADDSAITVDERAAAAGLFRRLSAILEKLE